MAPSNSRLQVLCTVRKDEQALCVSVPPQKVRRGVHLHGVAVGSKGTATLGHVIPCIVDTIEPGDADVRRKLDAPQPITKVRGANHGQFADDILCTRAYWVDVRGLTCSVEGPVVQRVDERARGPILRRGPRGHEHRVHSGGP